MSDNGEMRYRPLGHSGLMVSVVGLGCNNFGRRIGPDETRAVVDAALDAGVNLLDTADTYGNRGGSETLLGEVLKGRRDDVVIATKFGSDMGGEYGDDRGPAAPGGTSVAPSRAPSGGSRPTTSTCTSSTSPTPTPRSRRRSPHLTSW